MANKKKGKKCAFKNKKGECILRSGEQCFHLYVQYHECPILSSAYYQDKIKKMYSHTGKKKMKGKAITPIHYEQCKKCGNAVFKDGYCWECYKREKTGY